MDINKTNNFIVKSYLKANEKTRETGGVLFIIHVAKEGLVPRIYKYLLQIIKKTTSPVENKRQEI